MPGVVIAIQTFGDLLGYNPHLRVLISDGCFHPGGMLTVAPAMDTHAVEELFRYKVLNPTSWFLRPAVPFFGGSKSVY